MVNTCYMMKLGWDLIINRESLWVKVARAKYNCGNLLTPNVRCGSKVSHIWKRITSAWNLVEQNISWVIRDGQSIRFWQDSRVPGIGPLIEHVSSIPDHAWNFTVSTFVSEEGSCGIKFRLFF